MVGLQVRGYGLIGSKLCLQIKMVLVSVANKKNAFPSAERPYESSIQGQNTICFHPKSWLVLAPNSERQYYISKGLVERMTFITSHTRHVQCPV
jgi:hypothetical protein